MLGCGISGETCTVDSEHFLLQQDLCGTALADTFKFVL